MLYPDEAGIAWRLASCRSSRWGESCLFRLVCVSDAPLHALDAARAAPQRHSIRTSSTLTSHIAVVPQALHTLVVALPLAEWVAQRPFVFPRYRVGDGRGPRSTDEIGLGLGVERRQGLSHMRRYTVPGAPSAEALAGVAGDTGVAVRPAVGMCLW